MAHGQSGVPGAVVEPRVAQPVKPGPDPAVTLLQGMVEMTVQAKQLKVPVVVYQHVQASHEISISLY